MNQWEKFDADMLLDIADSTNAPDENDDPWGSVVFDARDGWKVSIFYDCGELDYIEHFVAPDGEIIDFWKWQDTYLPNGDYDHDHRHPRNRLMAWRGVRRPETEEEKARREFMATLSDDELLAFPVAAGIKMAEAQCKPLPVFTNQVDPEMAHEPLHHTLRLVPAEPEDDGVVIYWTNGARTRLPS